MVRTKTNGTQINTKPPEQKPNLGGRPPKIIDYDLLQEACTIHCTGEECASLLDIDYDNLNQHLIREGHGGFTEYFKKYSSQGKMSLRRRQWHKAIDDDNTTMQIWLGKQNLGQKNPEFKATLQGAHFLGENILREPEAG